MINVVVASKTQEAEDICGLILKSENGSPLPSFEAGAHIDIYLPNDLVRQYSLCNPANEFTYYQIGVLKDPNSRGGSISVHDELKEGDLIQISEPRNLFPLNNDSARDILFAGGIGVTPILSMAEALAAKGKDFEMHYCSRSRLRVAYHQRITTSSYSDKVQFHFDDAAPEQKLDMKTELNRMAGNSHIYVCGPNGFMDYVLNSAKEAGWPSEQIHREYFSAAEVDDSAEALDVFDVEIKSTGKVISVQAEQTVVEALEDNGVFINVACEEGVCGTCITRVVDGEPAHRDVFMTDEEHAKNDQFTPCCSRSKSPKLVLDL